MQTEMLDTCCAHLSCDLIVLFRRFAGMFADWFPKGAFFKYILAGVLRTCSSMFVSFSVDQASEATSFAVVWVLLW
jgi:hypothetical protein